MRPRQACLGMARLPYDAKLTKLSRFNEAEASLPRNGVTLGSDRFWTGNASMRPRQACLGMECAVAVLCGGGRGFNEAEASLPRNGPGTP